MKDSRIAISSIPRRRLPLADRERFVRAWEQSDQTQRDFAHEHGLSYGTFRNWIRRLASAGGQPAPASPIRFQEIPLQELLGSAGTPETCPWEAEIRLPSGVILALAPGIELERVRQLLEAARC